MTEPAGQQPEPGYCLTEEDRDGTPYICTQKAGHPRPHKMVKRKDMTNTLRSALSGQAKVDTDGTAMVKTAAKARTDGLVEVDTDQPLDQRATVASIVKATGRSDTDLAYSDLIKIVNTAETLRFEGQTTIELYSHIDSFRRVLDQARAQEGERQPVDAAIIRQLPEIARQLTMQVEGWTLQRGIREDGGS